MRFVYVAASLLLAALVVSLASVTAALVMVAAGAVLWGVALVRIARGH
jgi:hypothetical protein